MVLVGSKHSVRRVLRVHLPTESCKFATKMMDALYFGFLLGCYFFGLMCLQLYAGLDEITLYRWWFGIVSGLAIVMGVLKRTYAGTFDYRTAWFSSFNALVASLLIFALLTILLSSRLHLFEVASFKELLYIAFFEFINHLFYGLIAITALSFLFKTMKNHGRN